ncbi:MAG: thioredoxin family protein [Flavobacteriales bacterium]|nr:thioredoxin family protein [Flavobacteriales bacterium]
MKRIVAISLLLAFSIATQAQTKFFEGTYKEAFAEAQKQNKYLFIDCYTDWCGWCKVADKKTFPAQVVADVLNQNFISVQVDMERGTGVALGMKYRVMGYPAYLMFTPDGNLAHSMSGYMENPADFATEVKKALDESNRSAYPSKLTNAVSFPKFYEASFTNKDSEQKRKNPKKEEVTAWLKNQKDLTSEAAWSVIYKFPLDEEFTQKFLDTRADYAELYGQGEVDGKVSGLAQQKLRTAMKSKDEADLKLALDFVDAYTEGDKESNKLYYRLKFCEGKEDWKEYVNCAQGLIDLHGLTANLGSVNGYGWTLYLNTDDKELLNTAINWMDEVVKADPNYAFLDTYAALLYKNGRYKEANDWATKAINTGKQNGENVEETEALRNKIIAAQEGG